MAKFDGIERRHVEEALRGIDEPWPRTSDKEWWIKFGGRIYPLKYVVRKASGLAFGVELKARRFTPKEAESLVKRLEFEVVKKQ